MKTLQQILNDHNDFHPVVHFDPEKDKLVEFNFSDKSIDLTDTIFNDTERFTAYVNEKLEAIDARYGIGGYNEHRIIYKRSPLFYKTPERYSEMVDTETAEPRRLHLGIDIWGKPNTPVMAPLDGVVHSLAFNNGFGDYGATIILAHQLEGHSFYTLYGHLSMASIKNLEEGNSIRKGDVFAEFGIQQENGSWPPHLHFQIIEDLQGMKGDYPGVCKYSEREKYLANCPDPDLILRMMQHVTEQS